MKGVLGLVFEDLVVLSARPEVFMGVIAKAASADIHREAERLGREA